MLGMLRSRVVTPPGQDLFGAELLTRGTWESCLPSESKYQRTSTNITRDMEFHLTIGEDGVKHPRSFVTDLA